VSVPRIRIDSVFGELPLLDLVRTLELDDIVMTTLDTGSTAGVLDGVGGALFVQRGRRLIVLADLNLIERLDLDVANVWAQAVVCAVLVADGLRPDDWPIALRQHAARTLLEAAPTTLASARNALAGTSAP